MGGNQEYLNQFYQDISNHRFSLIISEPLSRRHKGSTEPFGEENDVWVDQVSTRILCYYQPQKTLKSIHVQILAPRTDPGTCAPTGDHLDNSTTGDRHPDRKLLFSRLARPEVLI